MSLLPKTIEYDHNPTGTVTLGNLRLCPNQNSAGLKDLVGEVIEGGSIGSTERIYGITESELQRGRVYRGALD